MRLLRLQIDGYKNVRGCDLEFTGSHLIHAVIGGNGSGKSNLIEALLQILIGFYFKKPPEFSFRLEYEAQNRHMILRHQEGMAEVVVDGQPISIKHFARRLRDGPAQVFYPELILVYYSGECRRVQQLMNRYRRHFQLHTRTPETDRLRPMFIQSSNEQSKIILLALFAHGYTELLHLLNLESIEEVCIRVRSPEGFDPDIHEPKLWNTDGVVRRILAALDETSSSQNSQRRSVSRTENVDAESGEQPKYREDREYRYESRGRDTGWRALAQRLEKGSDNLYLALENLKGRGILRSVSFQLRGSHSTEAFSFEQLSEGEKQLLAVVGAVQLTNQRNNLILLDEPDTHLNPHWSWEYPSLLTRAFTREQQLRSTVLMATHDPVMISGMVREQVVLAQTPKPDHSLFSRPYRHPRGQGVANILCSSEFFGLPSSLDKETQKLLDERLDISIKTKLTADDKARLKVLNEQLEILPGVSERDPDYVAFLRQRYKPESES